MVMFGSVWQRFPKISLLMYNLSSAAIKIDVVLPSVVVLKKNLITTLTVF
jgi:hypothetical protein